MPVRTRKEEIVYLLTKVIEKYESQTGQRIVRNSNRKNYEEIARTLSAISNELPHTAETLGHDPYPPDYNPKKLDYPFRKYDITGNQIKDAYFNQIVANPRSFLVDACYIYLYGVGKKGFQSDPRDPNLVPAEGDTGLASFGQENAQVSMQDLPEKMVASTRPIFSRKVLWAVVLLLSIGLIFAIYQWLTLRKQWETVKKEMQIMPYRPSQAEIDSLEGIWLCYTGSPQARISDSSRYHKVVSNILDVKYKNGYFTFTRYGASFDHVGHMQFEAPWLVSIHSYVQNSRDSIQSPRHSLMQLNKGNPFVSVISASWNFDVGIRNQIIGIREVYVKQGKGGTVEEVINTLENASCRCKIVNWWEEEKLRKRFYLRNEVLDTFQNAELKNLLNEKSILLREPLEGLILSSDSVGGK